MNGSRRHRHPPERKRRIEFEMTGVLAGIGSGLSAGLVVEIGAGGDAIIMTLGGLAGLGVGGSCEALRL